MKRRNINVMTELRAHFTSGEGSVERTFKGAEEIKQFTDAIHEEREQILQEIREIRSELNTQSRENGFTVSFNVIKGGLKRNELHYRIRVRNIETKAVKGYYFQHNYEDALKMIKKIKQRVEIKKAKRNK